MINDFIVTQAQSFYLARYSSSAYQLSGFFKAWKDIIEVQRE